jgi:hypothetical protein
VEAHSQVLEVVRDLQDAAVSKESLARYHNRCFGVSENHNFRLSAFDCELPLFARGSQYIQRPQPTLQTAPDHLQQAATVKSGVQVLLPHAVDVAHTTMPAMLQYWLGQDLSTKMMRATSDKSIKQSLWPDSVQPLAPPQ